MTELKNLTVEEVSIVDEGANPGAKVVFFKRNEEEPAKKFHRKEEADRIISELLNRINKKIDTLEEVELKKEASKYEILGEKAEDLTAIFKAAKESGTYNELITTLNKALDLLKKSGTFEEIGKSGNRNSTPSVEKIAKKIQQAEPSLTWRQAVDKAFLSLKENK